MRFERSTEDSDGPHQPPSSVSACDENRSIRGDRRTTLPHSPVDSSSSLARGRPRDNNVVVEFLKGQNGPPGNARSATFSSFRLREKDTSGGGCSDDRWQHNEPLPEMVKSKNCVTARPLLGLKCLPVATAEAHVTAGATVTALAPVVTSGAPVVTAGTLNESLSPSLDRVIVVDGVTVCDRIDRILLLQKNIRSSNV